MFHRPASLPSFAGAALLALLSLVPALALDFPVLSGRVVDDAGILDAGTRAALTQKLAEFEAKTSDQLVVVTLKSLQGTSVEDFGVELGRHWQIGQ
ncbi:MAG TPA: TPM domain-containing protein, partial [Burkholderiales bacterium]|nr:TPM domain-containing protein [Burkholderiales bacterium]